MKKNLNDLKIKEETNKEVQSGLNKEISLLSDRLDSIETCLTEKTIKITVSKEEIERLRMFIQSLESEISLLFTTNEDIQFAVSEQKLRSKILGKAVKM